MVAYGAAAKCMTMLNYCGITPDLVPAIGDANPRKQGMLCPGVRIPVVSPQALLAMDPDVIVIGAWNFKDEIIRTFRERGYRGEFLVPLPMPFLTWLRSGPLRRTPRASGAPVVAARRSRSKACCE